MSTKWACVIVIFTCGLFRFESLTARPLWYDELFTLDVIVHSSSLSDVWSIALRDGSEHPPLFYSICWIFSRFLPLETALRLPSTFAALAAAIGLLLWGKALKNSQAGLLAALLFTISPYSIDYSQEGRAYMLLGCLVLFALLYFKRYLEEGLLRWLSLASILLLGALYSHHLALLAIPAFCVLTIQSAGQLPRSIFYYRGLRLAIAAFAVLIIYAPQFELLQRYISQQELGTKHSLALSYSFFDALIHRWTGGIAWLWLLFWLIGTAAVVIKRQAGIGLLALSIFPMLFFALVPFTKFFDIRFIFPAYLPTLLLASLGASIVIAKLRHLNSSLGTIAAIGIVLLAYLPSVLTLHTFRRFPERCHNFFYRGELLTAHDGFCQDHLILNSLNPEQTFLLHPYAPRKRP